MPSLEKDLGDQVPVVVELGLSARSSNNKRAERSFWLMIQMRARRPFMGPVRSEIVAEVLPVPEGARTMKLRCDSCS